MMSAILESVVSLPRDQLKPRGIYKILALPTAVGIKEASLHSCNIINSQKSPRPGDTSSSHALTTSSTFINTLFNVSSLNQVWACPVYYLTITMLPTAGIQNKHVPILKHQHYIFQALLIFLNLAYYVVLIISFDNHMIQDTTTAYPLIHNAHNYPLFYVQQSCTNCTYLI